MKQRQYYKSFDILKFVCAIIIACVYHYQNDFPDVTLFANVPFVNKLSMYGYMLVELFFIISGFLFFVSYFNKIKDNDMNIKTFLKKRYIRLIFVAGITTFIMFILQQVYYLRNGTFWIWGNNDLGNLLLQLVGIQHWLEPNIVSLNNAVWYISVLLLCYIVFFYISKLVVKKKNIFIFLLPVVVALLVQNYGLNIPFLNYNVTRGLVSFGIGVFLGCLTNSLKNKRSISISSFIALVIVGLLYVFLGDPIVGDLLFFLTFIVYPLLILFLISIDNKLKFINDKVTKYLGSLSFGIYLWNLPIQLVTVLLNQIFRFNFNYDSISFFLIQIVIHILIAIISYHLFERKLLPFFEKRFIKIINFFKKFNQINVKSF